MNFLPVPQGDYVLAKRHGGLIITSGMTPRRNGTLIRTGRITRHAQLEDYKEAVTLACENALTAARAMLAKGESLSTVLSMTIFVAAEEGFHDHSRLADYASVSLKEQLGVDGLCSRCALGVASLPGDAPVEIQIIAAV